MNLKSISASVCLTTGALLLLSTSAHAITYSLSSGSLKTATTTTEGSFTNFTQGSVATVDFNSATLAKQTYTYTNPTTANGNAIYTGFPNNTVPTTITGIHRDVYAPPGPAVNITQRNNTNPPDNTQPNNSLYLSVFNANSITIDFRESNNTTVLPVRYFGLDWGFGDENNTVEFFSNGSSVGRYTGTQIFGTINPNDEPSSYVNFFANGTETFDRVVLSNAAPAGGRTTGFETDNHSYSRTAVPWTPSPILDLMGLGALGTAVWLKRKQKNTPKLLSQLWLKSKLN